MRALGVDLGSVRIGVALSDPAGRIALGLETVPATPRALALDRIVAAVDGHGVSLVVVGLPLELDGREGAAVRRVRGWAAELGARVRCPIVEWDERMTSLGAERALATLGVRGARRKAVVDQSAACLILQGWLDHRASVGP